MEPSRITDFEDLLARALALAGLDTSVEQAVPIRFGENAVIGLPGAVARIARPGQAGTARREVAVARWLAGSGLPTVAPLEGVRNPVVVDGRAVTFWEKLPPHRPGTVEDLAALLRGLHALPVPGLPELGELDPFARVGERLDGAAGFDPGDIAWLRRRLARLRSAWSRFPAGRGRTVVHGDAWTGNVARHSGGAVLLDLERCAVGPPEWDLVFTAMKTGSVPWLGRAEYARFVEAYGGRDVLGWEGFALMRDIRELRMTTYFIQHAAREDMRAEAALRIDCLRGRRGPRPWPWTPAT